MIENELSFLISSLPDLAGAPKKEIEQHYLSSSSSPLRIRKYGKDAYELTKKLTVAADDRSRKEEINIPLTRDEFEMLLPLAKRSIKKTRHYVPLPGKLTAEIDVFQGPLDGLIMVEVEFKDEALREDFVAPPWFGRDVSQEEWSSNSWLAGKTYEDVKKFVK